MKKSATVLVCAMLAGAVQAGTTYRCTDGVGTVTVTQDGCGPDTVTMETDDGTRGPASIRRDEADAPPAASPAPVAPLAHVEEKQEKLIFYDLSQTDIVAIRSGLVSVLKDPDSARYGAMAATTTGDSVATVCGTVNARNSFGGFTGQMPYFGSLIREIDGAPSAFSLLKLAADYFDIQLVTAVCAKYGMTFSRQSD